MKDGLGLDSSGGHAEPPVEEPTLASWYNLGPRPGDVGPAVILGHVNGKGKEGIFAHLDRVREKDLILVRDENGNDLSFQVYRAAKIEKADFPQQDVYGNTDGPELRLITCGGALDTVHHRYLSNVIVWAKLVG
jgi:sortase (surface protein transpeptidase)